ncbi:hypothetical protein P879_04546 [Paragonimus westermani]|uniref:Uncharacterized protein n=1 Tax=Paragonimus westermani TaxID=34504 RepID=A0A8T0DE71_9TREM|nr:hypothetical protein P879_04546 [Paragonimus westermani]
MGLESNIHLRQLLWSARELLHASFFHTSKVQGSAGTHQFLKNPIPNFSDEVCSFD